MCLDKIIRKILIPIFILSMISNCYAEEIFLSLKKDKVNVRYGPTFDSPIKFIYTSYKTKIHFTRTKYVISRTSYLGHNFL